jgi:hypothetical protein
MSDAKRAREQAAEDPLAWFLALERARRTRDAELERLATSELRRLGVEVRFLGGTRSGRRP